MNTIRTERDPGRSVARWVARLGAGLLLCAVATLPSALAGFGAPPTATDDETVGTLPILDGGSLGIDVLRRWEDPRPALYLEGSGESIANALLAAEGEGVATLEDLGSGQARLTFYGTVRVHLDRVSLDDDATLEIGLSLQPSAVIYEYGPTMLGWNGQVRSLGALSVGQHRLPVQHLEAHGALDLAPLDASTSLGAGGAQARHRFVALGEVLTISQSY